MNQHEKNFNIPNSGFNEAIQNTQKQPKETSEPTISEESGFQNTLRVLKTQKQQLEKELEALPFTTETFTVQEMQQIIEIKKRLDDYIDQFNQNAQVLIGGSPEYIKLCNEYIEKVIGYLNSLSIWVHKFSTECSGGNAVGPLETTPDDSIYYVTARGVSLRVKKVNRDSGLSKVIQPFFEKIIFIPPDKGNISDKPELGSSVKEYSTREFFDLQNQTSVTTDYHSRLKTYHKNNNAYYVEVPKSSSITHEGDRINNIF